MTEQCRLITKEQLDYYKGLEKKLAIATKALELYQNEEPPRNCPKEDEKGSYYPFRYNYVVAKEALKQIEELDR